MVITVKKGFSKNIFPLHPMYIWQDRQRPQKRYPLPLLELFFLLKCTSALLKSIMVNLIMCVYRVKENDTASQCKYDQNLKSVGLDYQYLRHKTKIKTPLNTFALRIPRIKCLCGFKVTERPLSDVF